MDSGGLIAFAVFAVRVSFPCQKSETGARTALKLAHCSHRRRADLYEIQIAFFTNQTRKDSGGRQVTGVRPMITTTIIVSGIVFGMLGFFAGSLCRGAKRADENVKRT
jgi:hypothetical protein